MQRLILILCSFLFATQALAYDPMFDADNPADMGTVAGSYRPAQESASELIKWKSVRVLATSSGTVTHFLIKLLSTTGITTSPVGFAVYNGTSGYTDAVGSLIARGYYATYSFGSGAGWYALPFTSPTTFTVTAGNYYHLAYLIEWADDDAARANNDNYLGTPDTYPPKWHASEPSSPSAASPPGVAGVTWDTQYTNDSAPWVQGLLVTELGYPNTITTSGTWTHGSTNAVISGLEFGTKVPAAPLLWDDCENGTVGSYAAVIGAGTGAVRNDGRTGWDQSAPKSEVVDSSYSTQYRTSWASIPQAHSKSTKYLAGGHYEDCGSGGACNLVYVGVSLASAYDRWFVMYYLRLPDEWKDVPISAPNYKEFRIGTAGCDESDTCSCYYAHAGDPNSVYEGTATILQDGNCSECSGGGWGDMYTPNPALAWRHRELRAENIDGYLSIKTANVEATGGPVDCDAGETLTSRGSIGNWNIGGYAGAVTISGGRSTDSRMKRFWDDLYIDTTWSRVMLCNNATYASATICEPQIPSAWADGSITVKVNQGGLSYGTNYLFVFDSDNVANTTGVAVTLGGTTPPSAQGCTISGGTFR